MSYFNEWMYIINNIQNDNTYKAAWGRAIIECVLDEQYEEQNEDIVLYLYDIVQNVMKYYWNQVAFFNLSQGPSQILENRIKEIKDEFQKATKNTSPVWYDKIEQFLKRNPIRFERQVKKFTTFVTPVATKFKSVGSKKSKVYDFEPKGKLLRFTPEQINTLKEKGPILIDLLHYRWSSLLEEYNKASNLIKKINGSIERKIRKTNLTKHRNLLLEYYHVTGAHDFYTGELLRIDDIKLEHVIPYHFIFGCDIWNLVTISKETRKVKRNQIPTEEEIKKLNQRNIDLLNALSNTKLHARYELENAIRSNLVQRYYIDLKG